MVVAQFICKMLLKSMLTITIHWLLAVNGRIVLAFISAKRAIRWGYYTCSSIFCYPWAVIDAGRSAQIPHSMAPH